MSRVTHGLGAPTLFMLVLAVLVVANLAQPAAAPAIGSITHAASGCSVDSIRGGIDIVGAIDGGCALSGIGAVFFKASPVGLAFCAGWGVGRWLDGYIYG